MISVSFFFSCGKKEVPVTEIRFVSCRCLLSHSQPKKRGGLTKYRRRNEKKRGWGRGVDATRESTDHDLQRTHCVDELSLSSFSEEGTSNTGGPGVSVRGWTTMVGRSEGDVGITQCFPN